MFKVAEHTFSVVSYLLKAFKSFGKTKKYIESMAKTFFFYS